MLHLIKGDLLNCDAQYIAHQTNCISQNAGGLALDLFIKYPYADCYKRRKNDDVPGTINIRGDGKEQRFVIALFAQYYPGGPKTDRIDSKTQREVYFAMCLDEIFKIKNMQSIAFPNLIGCGLAKGDWNIYKSMLEDFSNKTAAKVFIVQK
jgi:O-acetyl-ADP-ribose deacetylase (regulator of RNase III)